MIVKAKWLLVWCVGMSLVGGCKKIAALRGAAVDRATAAAWRRRRAPERRRPPRSRATASSPPSSRTTSSASIARAATSFVRVVDYYERVNEKTGPTGKESGIWIYELSSSPQCLTALDKGKKAEPVLADIDSMADAYRAEVRQADTPLEDGARLLRSRRLQRRQTEERERAHSLTLRAAFVDFQKVHDPFDAKVIALNDSINQRRLERLSKDPHAKLEYLIERGVADAKKLIHLAESKHQAARRTGLHRGSRQIRSLVQRVRYLCRSARRRGGQGHDAQPLQVDRARPAQVDQRARRRKRDNKDFTKESGTPQFIEGHLAQVFEKYNDFIDAVDSGPDLPRRGRSGRDSASPFPRQTRALGTGYCLGRRHRPS